MIRLATMKDVAAIAELVATGDKEFSAAPQIFRSGNLDEVLNYVKNDSAIVSDADGVINGMLCVSLTGERGMIGDLVVAVDARGTGIGRELVRFGHKMVADNGATTALAVIWHEKGLQPFYESVGYRQIGIVMEAAL